LEAKIGPVSQPVAGKFRSEDQKTDPWPLTRDRESVQNNVNRWVKRNFRKNGQELLTSVADPIDFPSRKRHQSATRPTSQLKSG
jgi:hypothetical protein